MALELDDEWRAARGEITQVGECDHAISAGFEGCAFKFRGCHGIEPCPPFRKVAESLVMVDHCLAVGGNLQITFDAVTSSDGGGEGGGSVFNDFAAVMQTAMCDPPGGQPFHSRSCFVMRSRKSHPPPRLRR